MWAMTLVQYRRSAFTTNKGAIMAEVTSGADRTIIILNNEEASALTRDLNFLNIDGDLSPELHSLADAMGVTMVLA